MTLRQPATERRDAGDRRNADDRQGTDAPADETAGECAAAAAPAAGRRRARDLGIRIGRLPVGVGNAITDIHGVRVAHTTVSWGGEDLLPGRGPARTGVTAILPHEGDVFHERVRAGVFAANGVGEVVGSTAIREWGLIETPIVLTSSQSIGTVYDATVQWMMARDPLIGLEDVAMPVVGECDDSLLNDARGMHVRPEHVHAALGAAAAAAPRSPIELGSVGAGTGMICYDFKGGIGTSSRLMDVYDRRYTIGVLVLTNFGRRHRLLVDGVPVGREIPDLMPGRHNEGSCIVVCATDAPLSSRQCERVAKRCSLGLAVTGSYASDDSGEIMLAFSTADRLPRATEGPLRHERIGDDVISLIFEAAVDATAEAVLDSLLLAETTVGRGGYTAWALPVDRLTGIMAAYGRPLTA